MQKACSTVSFFWACIPQFSGSRQRNDRLAQRRGCYVGILGGRTMLWFARDEKLYNTKGRPAAAHDRGVVTRCRVAVIRSGWRRKTPNSSASRFG